MARLRPGRATRASALILLGALAVPGAPQSQPSAGDLERIGVAFDGSAPDGPCDSPAISADGRFVAFASTATNLLVGGTDGKRHVFVRDRIRRKTELITRSVRGTAADGDSFDPAISPDGRYVTFASRATNLVAGGTNGKQQIFVRDRRSGRVELLSCSSAGHMADAECRHPSIGAPDAQQAFWIAFESDATNLIEGQTDADGLPDVFVRYRDPFRPRQNTTTLVSAGGTLAAGSSFHPMISDDGGRVAFLFRPARWVAPLAHGESRAVPVRPWTDVLVHDQRRRKTKSWSINDSGDPADDETEAFSFSGDGRSVVFSSRAHNLDGSVPEITQVRDVFYHGPDRSGSATITRQLSMTPSRVAPCSNLGVEPNRDSGACSISFQGRFVVFQSLATNMASDYESPILADDRVRGCGGPEIFVREVLQCRTVRVASIPCGMAPNGPSDHPVISADGRVVVFESYATNLVGPGDPNIPPNIYAALNPLFGAPPGVEEVSPAFARRGTTIELNIRGCGFQEGARVVLNSYRDAPGPPIEKILLRPEVTPTRLVFPLTIPSAAPVGYRSVTVTNPDGSPDRRELAFVVTSEDRKGRLNASSLTFPVVAPGRAIASELTVWNAGDGPLTFSLISATEPFLIPGAGRPYVLAPGKCLPVSLVFAPPVEACYSGTVTLHSDDPGAQTCSVNLTGVAVSEAGDGSPCPDERK